MVIVKSQEDVISDLADAVKWRDALIDEFRAKLEKILTDYESTLIDYSSFVRAANDTLSTYERKISRLEKMVSSFYRNIKNLKRDISACEGNFDMVKRDDVLGLVESLLKQKTDSNN